MHETLFDAALSVRPAFFRALLAPAILNGVKILPNVRQKPRTASPRFEPDVCRKARAFDAVSQQTRPAKFAAPILNIQRFYSRHLNFL